MPKTDANEARRLAAFNQGALTSQSTPEEMAKLQESARATVTDATQGNARTLAAVRAAKAGQATGVSLEDL